MNHDEKTKGLTATEAALRLASEGANSLPDNARRRFHHILLEALREPMFILLLFAAALYLVIGELQEGFFLCVMVLATLGLTLYQEDKTERALDALRDMSIPSALVIRDGVPQTIDGRQLVRGDVLILDEGDRIAADGVLISGSGLQIDESLLTGESVPVYKTAEAGHIEDAASADNDSALYAGTLIVQGNGTARITKTGIRSEMGRIGSALKDISPESSLLQKQMARLIKTFAVLGLSLSLLLTLIEGWLHGDWLQGLLAGIALAMSMMPEEFAVILAVFPALGAWRLARAQVLTRRLSAIETLGTTSILCTDKTGTLTENMMTVARLYIDNEEVGVNEMRQVALPSTFHSLLELSILASRILPLDPMEKAFHRAGKKFLQNMDVYNESELHREYALTPELRAMSQGWKSAGRDGYLVAAKGAPETIAELCRLEAADRERILAAADRMASEGLRVLGVARANFHGAVWPQDQRDFSFAFSGLVGLADPLRKDIPDAIRECRAAGIRVIMITGDYPLTARTIAREAGLADGDVLTGDVMSGLDDVQLSVRMKTTTICARITPDQKLRIVQALKADGEVVAMTGDGVNDAPALKAAHVGVAMGKRGTEVAREAASLVLLDDRFTSIVQAIRMGRAIFANMRKAMTYVLSMHVPIAGMALAPLLLGWPIMLYPMHIVFLELIIDPACSLAFENEPPDDGIMNEPPRNPHAPLFTGPALLMSFVQGIVALATVALAYRWSIGRMPEEAARAFAFAVLIAANLALIFSNRAQRSSLIAALRKPNIAMWSVMAAAICLLLLSLSLPLLMNIFRFASLPASQILIALAIGMFSVFWYEPIKWWQRSAAGNHRRTAKIHRH